MGAGILYFRRVNPEMFAVRSRVHPGTKRWDRIVIGLLFLAMLAIPPVAGLDDGRFHWSRMSWEFVALGYFLLVAGMVLMGRNSEPVRVRAWNGCSTHFSGAGIRANSTACACLRAAYRCRPRCGVF
jgi:hypothetical protein